MPSPKTSDTGKSNSEKIQRGSGAAHHAESKVNDEERGHAGQGNTQRACKQGRSPVDDGPQAILTEAGRSDGQGAEPIDQNLDEAQVAIQGQKGHGHQQGVELPQHGCLLAVLGVHVVGEGQPHAVREQLAAQRDGVEDHLHAEAKGDTDDDLLHGDDEAWSRERSDAGG